MKIQGLKKKSNKNVKIKNIFYPSLKKTYLPKIQLSPIHVLKLLNVKIKGD